MIESFYTVLFVSMWMNGTKLQRSGILYAFYKFSDLVCYKWSLANMEFSTYEGFQITMMLLNII